MSDLVGNPEDRFSHNSRIHRLFNDCETYKLKTCTSMHILFVGKFVITRLEIAFAKRLYEPRHEKTGFLYMRNKGADQLISAFVFAA